MSKIKVAVHGSYFARNYGDTLLVKIMCDFVASRVGKENVFLAGLGDKIEQDEIGYPVVPAGELGSITHLIYGGGGYLGERDSRFFSNLRWSIRNYFRHVHNLRGYKHCKKLVIGTGFGPVSNSLLRNQFKGILESAEEVLVRDIESLNFIQQYGIKPKAISTCVDLALSLESTVQDKAGIAIHVDNYTVEEISTIIGVLDNLGHKQIKVIFDNYFSDNAENRKKYEVANQGRVMLQFIPYKRFDDTLTQVDINDFVITSKLHVGITTIALGGKVISIPSHQKTFRLFNQLKLQDFCIPRSELRKERLVDAMSKLSTFSPDRTVIVNGIKKINEALDRFLIVKP